MVLIQTSHLIKWDTWGVSSFNQHIYTTSTATEASPKNIRDREAAYQRYVSQHINTAIVARLPAAQNATIWLPMASCRPTSIHQSPASPQKWESQAHLDKTIPHHTMSVLAVLWTKKDIFSGTLARCSFSRFGKFSY